MLTSEWLIAWNDFGLIHVNKENKKINERIDNLEKIMNDINSKFDLITFLIKKDINK